MGFTPLTGAPPRKRFTSLTGEPPQSGQYLDVGKAWAVTVGIRAGSRVGVPARTLGPLTGGGTVMSYIGS